MWKENNLTYEWKFPHVKFTFSLYWYTLIEVTVQDFYLWALAYLQVSLHERRPGLHQVVTDTPLTGGGGFMERRLASETHIDYSILMTHVCRLRTFWIYYIKNRTHVSLSVMSRWDVGTKRDRNKTFHQWTVWRNRPLSSVSYFTQRRPPRVDHGSITILHSYAIKHNGQYHCHPDDTQFYVLLKAN